MRVDVLTEIEIDRPRAEVAAFACDPDNATARYENIKSVEWKTQRPLAVGSQIAFRARFLGRNLVYLRGQRADPRRTIRDRHGRRPILDGDDIYTWQEAGPDRTRMTLRNQGQPSGFASVAAPMMSRAMRRTDQKDLARLKQVIESQEVPT